MWKCKLNCITERCILVQGEGRTRACVRVNACVCACDMTDKECVGGGGQSYRPGPDRPLSQLFPDLLQLNQHGLCRAAGFFFVFFF